LQINPISSPLVANMPIWFATLATELKWI